MNTKPAIYIGLGANLPSPVGPPVKTIRKALTDLERTGLRIQSCSHLYQSAAMPASDQPDYVNAVIGINSEYKPQVLMSILLKIEKAYGRVRGEKNAARSLDLDILDYCGQRLHVEEGPGVVLPHPRLQERGFVLVPLAEISPNWRHPVSDISVQELIKCLNRTTLPRRIEA